MEGGTFSWQVDDSAVAPEGIKIESVSSVPSNCPLEEVVADPEKVSEGGDSGLLEVVLWVELEHAEAERELARAKYLASARSLPASDGTGETGWLVVFTILMDS